MAINTTGQKATVNGITAVHPDNIGKGIKFNPETGKYEVAIKENQPININDSGELEVRLSTVEKNILQIRDGGLFLSTDPADHYKRFYVKSDTGSDDNDGSFNSPFRTLDKAIASTPNIISNVDIYLYKGLDYHFPELHNRWKSNVNISMHAYDENMPNGGATGYPYSLPSNAYYRGHVAKNYPRPKVYASVKEENSIYTRQTLLVNRLAAYGISFIVNDAIQGVEDTSKSGSYDGIFGRPEKTEFTGCTISWVGPSKITLNSAGWYRTDAILRGDILWINSKLLTNLENSTIKGYLITSNFTSSFTVIDWHGANLESYGQGTNYPTLTHDFDGLIENITKNVIHNSQEGGYINNVALNFIPK